MLNAFRLILIFLKSGDDENTKSLLAEVEENRKHYSVLFDPKEHQEAVERGDRRLSYKALQASLLIMLYQNEPILQQPASLIKLCIDVDELMTLWRYVLYLCGGATCNGRFLVFFFMYLFFNFKNISKTSHFF